MSSLPHGIAEPLHINEPFPTWTLLAGGLVLWMLYRLFRVLKRRLAAPPPLAVTPPRPPTADHGFATVIESIRRRYRERQAYRRGCHELAAALREHLERSSEKPKTTDPLTSLTAAEMTETIGDSAIARFFGLLSGLQFHRRAPTRSDFDGACDLALEVAKSPSRWRSEP